NTNSNAAPWSYGARNGSARLIRTVVLLTYDQTFVGTVTRLTSGPPTNCVWLCTTMCAWVWSRVAAAKGNGISVPVALSKICSTIILPTIVLPLGLCAVGR